jgi:hypothetical protein
VVDRRVHGVDSMYTGLHGRFRIPYTDSTSATRWKQRCRMILRDDPTFFVYLYHSKNGGTVSTIAPSVDRVDEVMQTTDQYRDIHINTLAYSIRIIFDLTGMTLEFRRDINNVYLVLQTLSSIVGWDLNTHDDTYHGKFELFNDPVILKATCLLLQNNCRYPQCMPRELRLTTCVSIAFTRQTCTNRHHALAMTISAAADAIKNGGHVLSVARPAYTVRYGKILPRFNSETYDVDLFERNTPTLSIQHTLSLDRRNNSGERLVIYTSLYNHGHVRSIINRDYIPAYDILARHFVSSGHCRPLLKQIHYHTMGMEAWVFEGGADGL